MDLLTRVNYNVAYKFESHHKTKKPLRGKKQVPCVMSVLTKKLYLKKKWKLWCGDIDSDFAFKKYSWKQTILQSTKRDD